MYKIDQRPSGYVLTFAGFIDKAEMQRWYDESAALLASAPSSFGVIVDMRGLKPLPPDAQAAMVAGQALYRDKGMRRSAVVLHDTVTTLQFKRLAKESGISPNERYIDASTTVDWTKAAVAWVKDGIEP